MTTVSIDLFQPRSQIQDIKRRYSNFNTMQLNKKQQILKDVLYLIAHIEYLEKLYGTLARELDNQSGS